MWSWVASRERGPQWESKCLTRPRSPASADGERKTGLRGDEQSGPNAPLLGPRLVGFGTASRRPDPTLLAGWPAGSRLGGTDVRAPLLIQVAARIEGGFEGGIIEPVLTRSSYGRPELLRILRDEELHQQQPIGAHAVVGVRTRCERTDSRFRERPARVRTGRPRNTRSQALCDCCFRG